MTAAPSEPTVLISIALQGFPPLPNESRRQGSWHQRAEDARTWRGAAYLVALDELRRSSHREDFPLRRAVVRYVVIRPDGRGPDLDNAVGAMKPILDGICDAKVLASDGRRHLVGLSVVYETGPIGCRVDVVMGTAA